MSFVSLVFFSFLPIMLLPSFTRTAFMVIVRTNNCKTERLRSPHLEVRRFHLVHAVPLLCISAMAR